MGMTDGLPFWNYQNRYKSILKINNTFTLDSYMDYLKHSNYRCFNPRINRWNKQSEYDLELVIFLRSNFSVPPSVIEQILKLHYEYYGIKGTSQNGDFQLYVIRLILKADYYIKKQDSKFFRSNSNSERYLSFSKPFNLLSAEDNFPSLDDISESIAIDNGPEICFAENGPFILSIQSGLYRQIRHREPDSKHEYYYCSVPCNFYYIENKLCSEKGNLLVRSKISDSFIKDINKIINPL
jgi:hypothetical protein